MPRNEQEYEELATIARNRLSEIDPEEFTPVAPQIVRLREAVQAKHDTPHKADTEITAAVNGMRLAGFSWKRIALVLGTSRQAAHDQYANKVEN